MHYTVGCDAEGRLTAVRARMIGDTGAYASVGGKVLERAAGHACGPYRVPHVDVEALAVYTNNPPCGAMRGFGANQAHFAMEGLPRPAGAEGRARPLGDALAQRARRRRHLLHRPGAGEVGRHPQDAAAVQAALRRGARGGRAVGIACGIKNSGIGNGVGEWGRARLVVEPDGTRVALQRLHRDGPGAAHGARAVRRRGDRAAGRDVPPAGRHDLRARLRPDDRLARDAVRRPRRGRAPARSCAPTSTPGTRWPTLAGRVYAADIVVDDTTALGAHGAKIKTHTAFGYATQVVVLDATGRVERVIAAHDVGRAVNPALCEGRSRARSTWASATR